MIKEFNLFEAPLKGISLVEAGAGTGKTYNIVSLYIRVLLEKELLPANILVLTYTEAATAELKTRLRKRLLESIQVLKGGSTDDPFLKEIALRHREHGLPILEQALYSFDEAAVSTIHGFCQRILKEESIAFNISADFEILPDDSELFQEQVDHFWRGFIARNDTDYDQSVINLIYEKGYTPDKLAVLVKETLSKPFAHILPDTEPIEFFELQFTKLRKSLELIKEAFFEEKELLNEIIHSEALNKSRYRNPSFLIDGLVNWLEQEKTTITPYNKLPLFGSFMNTEGSGLKKGKEIPSLKIWPLVDEYLSEYFIWENVEISWLKEAKEYISKNFQAQKIEKNLLNYQDLLEYTHSGLVGTDSKLAEIISEKYPVALVDEFQDTDPIQYDIFSGIYVRREDTALFMIGDPKQAIYSFRGADIFTYLKAKKEASSDQKYSLVNNYRSSSDMIDAVNELFDLTKDPFVIENIDFYPAQFPKGKDIEKSVLKSLDGKVAPLQFLELHSEGLAMPGIRKRISTTVANEILNLIKGGYSIDGHLLSQKDIAVLVRTHDQASLIQQALSQKGLKSIIKSKESVFHSPESDDLYLILSAIINPSFEYGIRAALSTEAMGFDGQRIWELLQDDQVWEKEYQKFIELSKLWNQKGTNALFSNLNNFFSLDKNYATCANSERKLTNLFHLIDLLSKAEQKSGYSPNQLLAYFRKQRQNTNSATDDEILRLESDSKLIQILTMHSSKGLEFPVVICPYLWEGIETQKKPVFSFHKGEEAYIDIGTKDGYPENRMESLVESLAEKTRLAYVSLTRAKSACFVVLVNGNNSELSPIASLLEGSSTILDRVRDKITLKPSDYRSKYSIDEYSLVSIYQKYGNDLISKLRAPIADLPRLKENSEQRNKEFEVLEFQRKDLQNHLKIVSFSSLTSGNNTHDFVSDKAGVDYDAFYPETNLPTTSGEELSIFSLPKGPKTGNLLHEIFEDVMLSRSIPSFDIVAQKIQKFGFEEQWASILNRLITTTLSYPLKDDMSLESIQKEDLLIEMEFHFPIQKVSSKKLKRKIRGSNSASEISSDTSGFMKGYIDLLFKHDGKYYILDYKSNYLGDTFDHYSEASLQDEILHSNYDLQYHIYCIAVHRMLKNSLPDYNFDTHFGGVFYLFLRGVNPEQPTTGVFFSRPEASLISELDEYFKSGIDE